MAETSGSPPSNASSSQSAATKPSSPLKPPNPVWRMMGIPNFRLRLPSRRWMIFLSVTGSLFGTLYYDRRQKRLTKEKWCALVSHQTQELMPADRMRRKVTVYLMPPPGDSLTVSKNYFKDYVKPILAAAALDYEIVDDCRRQGELRARLAEKIRRFRRKNGEPSTVQEEPDVADIICESRQRQGIREEDLVKGDIIIGRNTWKEYIRGLHEGWIGPVDPPKDPQQETSSELSSGKASTEDSVEEAPPSTTDAEESSNPSESESAPSKATKPDETTENKPRTRPPPTPPYIATSSYSTSPVSPTIPQTFEPSLPLAFPHILGFLNTPIRMKRFFTQRYLADRIGRDVAALVLATHTRPYATSESFITSVDPDDASHAMPPSTQGNHPLLGESNSLVSTTQAYEQNSLLVAEEPEWPKHVRQPKEPSNEETVWLDPVVMDPRIANRMSRFDLDPDEEARAQRIWEGKEGVGGNPPVAKTSTWEKLMAMLGLREEDKRPKIIIGDLDGTDGE